MTRTTGNVGQTNPGLWVVLGASAVLYAIRAFHPLTDAWFWAEDATIFFAQARELGLASLVEPYQGYLHTAPRLLAILLDRVLAPEYLPLAYAWLTLPVFMGVCAILHGLLNGLAPIPRVLASLSPVLVLHGGEVIGSLTNIQWPMAVAYLCCIVFLGAGHLAHRKRYYGFMAAAGITGPFCIVFLPVLALRALLERDWGRFPGLYRTAIAVAILQGIVLAISPPRTIGEGLNTDVTAWIDTVVGRLLLGLVPQSIELSKLVLLLTVVAGVGLLVGKAARDRRTDALLLFTGMTVVYAAGLWALKNDPFVARPTGAGARYYYIPLTGLLLLLAQLAAGRLAAGAAWFAWGILVAGSALGPFVKPAPSDLHWREYVELSRHIAVTIPVHPLSPRLRWTVDLGPEAGRAPATTSHVVPLDESLFASVDELEYEIEPGAYRFRRRGTDPRIHVSLPDECRGARSVFLAVAGYVGDFEESSLKIYSPDSMDQLTAERSRRYPVGPGAWHWFVPIADGATRFRIDVDGQPENEYGQLDLLCLRDPAR